MNTQAKKTNSLQGVVEIVLLAEPLSITADKLEQCIAEKIGTGKVKIFSMENQTASFVIELAGQAYSLILMDQPVPNHVFNNALAMSPGFKEGSTLVARHNAHFIVTSLTESKHLGQTISQSIGAMTLSGILAGQGRPLAYFWDTAELLMDHQQHLHALAGIGKAMQKQASGELNSGMDLPVSFWVSVKIFSPDQKSNFGGITKGLSSFTGYELEISPIAWKPLEVAKRAMGAVAYLFSKGPVLKAGQTLGLNEEEHFQIKLAPATESLSKRLVLTLVNNK